MSKIKTVPTPLDVDWSAPGALAQPRRELQATDYHAIEPIPSDPPSRIDWTGLTASVLFLGTATVALWGCVLGVSHWLNSLDPMPDPAPIVQSESESSDWGPADYALIAFCGIGGVWVLARLFAGTSGHPDCPNHCPSDRPCQCGERVSVDVSVKVR